MLNRIFTMVAMIRVRIPLPKMGLALCLHVSPQPEWDCSAITHKFGR